MAKDNTIEFELPKQDAPILKELAATKDIYSDMVRISWDMLQDVKTHRSKTDIASAYGLYHNSFTGLIRSGILCERYMGPDGFPEILGEKSYSIRESVLKALLGRECEQIVHPWKDESQSYLDDMEKFPEKYFISNGLKMKDAADEHNLSLELDDARKELEDMDKEHQAELNGLNSKYSKEIARLKAMVDKGKADFAAYKQSAEDAAREKEKYIYDPNYDHYYSDVLPKLIDSIEFTKTDILIRGICIGISIIFVLLCCIFLI